MPVIPPSIPDAVRKAFIDGVKDFYAREPQLVSAVLGSSTTIVGLMIFTPDPDGLASGQPIDFSAPKGWRVIARAPYEAVGADVVDARTGEFRATAFTRGPAYTRMIDTILTSLATGSLPSGVDFDPYLFRLSGSFLELCCLKSRSGNSDIFIPTVSGLKQLTHGKRYDSNAVAGALKQLESEIPPPSKEVLV